LTFYQYKYSRIFQKPVSLRFTAKDVYNNKLLDNWNFKEPTKFNFTIQSLECVFEKLQLKIQNYSHAAIYTKTIKIKLIIIAQLYLIVVHIILKSPDSLPHPLYQKTDYDELIYSDVHQNCTLNTRSQTDNNITEHIVGFQKIYKYMLIKIKYICIIKLNVMQYQYMILFRSGFRIFFEKLLQLNIDGFSKAYTGLGLGSSSASNSVCMAYSGKVDFINISLSVCSLALPEDRTGSNMCSG
ncbi:hypothetical protein AGLY_003800, partial [Aphis glycines]